MSAGGKERTLLRILKCPCIRQFEVDGTPIPMCEPLEVKAGNQLDYGTETGPGGRVSQLCWPVIL